MSAATAGERQRREFALLTCGLIERDGERLLQVSGPYEAVVAVAALAVGAGLSLAGLATRYMDTREPEATADIRFGRTNYPALLSLRLRGAMCFVRQVPRRLSWAWRAFWQR